MLKLRIKNCSLWQHLPRWLIGGLLYGLLEIIHHGHTHWTMIMLAALLCIPLDLTNELLPWHLPLWLQGMLGGLTITVAELLAGLVLNVWLGLGIWDYSHLFGNILGQICLPFYFIWIAASAVGIVMLDWMRYAVEGGERPRYTF